MGVICYTFMILCVIKLIVCDVGCRDPNGKPVDWFVIYKIPRLKESANPLIKEGLGHMYLDVNSIKWSMSNVSLNNSGDHALYYTLQQVYKGDSSEGFVMYNDEIPLGNTSFTNGHTKGVLAFNDDTGFWLVHSLPKFPPHRSDGYSYPHNGLTYGQTFLCVTYDYKQFVNIGEQLMYNYPNVYDYHLPDPFQSELTSMAMVVKGKHVTAEPWYNVVTLASQKGQKFVSFAKFTDFNADLYDALVAPTLKADLETETWMNGANKMPSNCTAKYTVKNIKHLSMPFDISFKDSQDHSKWGVSAKGPTVICIGDINRMETQKERAGGTLCCDIQDLRSAFYSAIDVIENC